MIEVYVLTWSVGLSSGQKRLVGIYTSFDKAKIAEKEYHLQSCFGEFSIDAVPLDKVVDIVYMDW